VHWSIVLSLFLNGLIAVAQGHFFQLPVLLGRNTFLPRYIEALSLSQFLGYVVQVKLLELTSLWYPCVSVPSSQLIVLVKHWLQVYHVAFCRSF